MEWIGTHTHGRTGKFDAHDPLGRFEAVFPRQGEPQRGAVLFRQRLAISVGGEIGEFVGRLRDRQPLGIGPGFELGIE